MPDEMPAMPDQIKITVAGKSYIFRPGEVTPRIARQVRQDTGMSLRAAMELLGADADVDVLATVCYAAALQTDPKTADLDEIDESFNYQDLPDVTVDFPTEEEGDPES